MAKGDTMRQWLTILLISLTLGLSGQNPRQSITWLRAEDITNTRYFIWRGDTIDFTRFVDSLYVSVTDTALFLATKNWVINNTVMMGDSINVYITPKQLRDSLGTLPGGHNPVTISQQGLNNGLSIDNDQILTIRAASTSQAGALTSNDYNIFNNKLNAVTHDNTLTGAGTVANPLKVDTSRIASKSWVLNFKFLTQEYRDYDSLYNTPFIPEIKNDPFGVDWQNDVDNGASRNAIYNAITGLGGGGGATNLSYSAYTDKGIVNSDTGTDAEIPAGSTVNASLMLPEDKEFLDTVEDSITAHRIKINSLKLVNIDSTGFRITKNQITDLTVGSSKWDDDTYGITYTGNVGIGGASSAAEKLRVTDKSTNFAVDVYNSSSTGKGLQVRAGGTNHSILDLANYTGTSRFSFSSNGKAKFSSYGQGNITGTVSKYLAVDSSGNIIEADGSSGGSSKWTDDTYGINYKSGKVGIGRDSPATEILGVQGLVSNYYVMDIYNQAGTGHGLRIRAGGTSTARPTLTLSHFNGVAQFTFNSTGTANFSKYGQGNITGTVAKYLAVDSSGNLIEADGTDGGGGGGVSSVAFSSSDFSVSGSPITSSGTITANLQGTAITNKTEITKGSVSKDDQLLVSKSGNLMRTAIDAIETYLNRKAKLSDNAVTFNYETVKKAELKITNNNNSFSITNLPDGGEGQIDIESTGNYTFNFSISSPLTIKVKMGENDNIKPSGRSTVVYWRTGTVLYYGFIWENDEQGEALNCPSPLINTVSSTGEFQMAHATFVDKDNGILYVGERVSGSAVARILKYDLSTLSLIDYYETGAGNSVENLVYHNGYVYASQVYDNGISRVVRILRINSTTMSGANTYDYPTLLSGTSFPLGTDGTYLYGATYNSSPKFFKIKLSDMSLVTTKDWTNGERAHALRMNTRTGHMYVTDIPNSEGDDVYFAKVSLSDLSYTDVNIGAYVRKATDDFAMIDTGSEAYCYVGGEYIYGSGHNAGYGAVQVKTSDLSLTGMSLKTTYGLAEFGNYVYSVTIDGNVQIFKHTNLGEIATCSLGGTYKGNEIIFDNSYGYVTNFNNYNKSDGKVIKINPT